MDYNFWRHLDWDRLQTYLNGFRTETSNGLSGLLSLRHLIVALLMAVCYFAVAKFGLFFAIPPGNATVVWPASGFSLAAILILGNRISWGIWLGATVATASTGVSIMTAAVIGFGNTFEALIAAWMIRKCMDLDSPFKRAMESFRFGLAAGVSTIVSATIGTTALLLTGYIDSTNLLNNWWTWWIGDVTGIVVVSPLILSLVAKVQRPHHQSHQSTLLIAFILLLLISRTIFGGWLSENMARDLLYITVIFMLWIAMTFTLREVAFVTVFISSAAIWGASRGVGAYSSGNIHQSLFDLQLFISLFALTGLALSGLVARRRTIWKSLRDMKFAMDQSAIVAITDSEGNLEQVNNNFCEISKFKREELLGEKHPILSSERHPNVLYRELDRNNGGNGVWHGEANCLSKDGDEFWVDTTVVPFLDDNNAPDRYLTICFDITDHKRADEQSRLLFQAVSKTTDLVFITNQQGLIEYVNPAFETITGYTFAEVRGQTPRILKSGRQKQELYKDLWDTILRGNVHRSTVINRKKCGELFNAEQTITPVKNDEGQITHFVSVLKDITELLKKKEQEVEMRLAREVQKLYFRAAANLPGFDIAATAHSAAETGGDYFDFIEMDDGCLCFVIGDVSGHGFGSALIMSETRAYVRAFVGSGMDVASVFTRINQALLVDLNEGRFVTMLMCCLDPRTKTLTYAGAGHIPGYLLGKSGKIDHILENTGPPLGIIANYKYDSQEVKLDAKDSVLMMITDGVVESMAPNDDLFGEERAIAHVISQIDKSAREISETLYQAARFHTGGNPQQDDITSIILKVQ